MVAPRRSARIRVRPPAVWTMPLRRSEGPEVWRSGGPGTRGDASKPSLPKERSGREGATLAAPRSGTGGLGPPVTLAVGRRALRSPLQNRGTETGGGQAGGAAGALPRVGVRRSLGASLFPLRWGGLGLAGAMLAGPRWDELGRLDSPRKGPGVGEVGERNT